MKKLILFAAILFVGVSVVKAQVGDSREGNVNLKVTLVGIHSIEIFSGQENVELKYDGISIYEEGAKKELKDHLRVYSNSGFSVNVKASTNFIATDGLNTEVMDLSTIKIITTKGTDNTDIDPLEGSKDLSLTATNIIESNVAGFNKFFSVEYQGGTDYGILFKDGAENVFTTDLVYTIVPN